MNLPGTAIRWKAIGCAVVALLLSSCGGKEEAGADGQVEARTIVVTLAEADSREVRDELFSVGRLVSRNTPVLAAEVSARVVDVRVDEGQAVIQGQVLLTLDRITFELAVREAQANIQRLAASIANEQRRVSRYKDLKAKDMMSLEKLDDAEAMLAVNVASMAAAEAQLAIAQNRLTKTELVSPVNGVVEKRHVSVGDFVKDGGALVTLTDTINLRLELPFPETVGDRLRTGQVLQLESPVAPGLLVNAVVDKIRPQVSAMSHSLMVISNITNPGPWRPLATVEGVLVADIRPGAVVVPSGSVVKRPAGDVLYVLDSRQDQEVHEVVVKTGVRGDGWIEISEGLNSGDVVVVEGASYLTDGAHVVVREIAQ
jgi:RND family efflux transporter MFP subunit